MRNSINIIDKNIIEVKGHRYTSEDTVLVFAISCLVQEYDDLKLAYDRLIEQQEKVKSIAAIEGMAYIMTFFDLSNKLGINRQTLMIITSRADFDKYRTYITVPRKHPALIVIKNSLKLLYTYLNEKSRINYSEQKFKTLLRAVINGYSC